MRRSKGLLLKKQCNFDGRLVAGNNEKDMKWANHEKND